MLKPWFAFSFILLMTGCVTIKNNQVLSDGRNQMIANGKLFTAIWMQRSAEYKALCLQAFNTADLRLDQILTFQKPAKPLAIVTDIDETFLDNSPYAIRQSLQGKDYRQSSWDQWVSRASADTIAGALSFFKRAAVKGTTIFYVTNRNVAGRKATLQNLQKYKFPFADEEHLLTMDGSSSKEARRLQISQQFYIALLIGDNLADFSAIFDKKTEAERTDNVMQHASDFGKHFIILPNPNYGDWEGALYQYNYQYSPARKDSIFRASGKSY
ncbi:MAG TPA: 5'-nucleotidase, lipoprotein e(P4) family [Arachidicoccus sp.]|nr:5'-nucleotidase, lipoprotein e(P4) family [Arachidicoccus sp.]